MSDTKTFGFIILRHVNSAVTNNYWIESYESIRQIYPETDVVIIDDDSNTNILDTEYEKTLYKTRIIDGEFPGRGEILPYYYYLKHKFFDTAVIIHDSIFIRKKLSFRVDKYCILWNFQHTWDQPVDEIRIIKSMNCDKKNKNKLLKFHSKKELWTGCFGVMMAIEYDFLKEIDEIYNIKGIVNHVKNRYERQSIERVLPCIFQKHKKADIYFGKIQEYCDWGISYRIKDQLKYQHLPMLKIWTGR